MREIKAVGPLRMRGVVVVGNGIGTVIVFAVEIIVASLSSELVIYLHASGS